MGRFEVMNRLILLSIFSLFSGFSHSSYLSGNVPYEILVEMNNSNCHPITDFYSLVHTQGGGRIGPPYIESDLNDGSTIMIAVCKSLDSDKYKVIIRQLGSFTEAKPDYCGKTTCPTMAVRTYKPITSCSPEIEMESFPGGVHINEHKFQKHTIDFSLLDDGGMGTNFQCRNKEWKTSHIH